jgi:hypothetical protein
MSRVFLPSKGAKSCGFSLLGLPRRSPSWRSNGATRLRLASGQEVIIQPGKDGALYMFDALHMGKLYDREQIVETCGVAGGRCSGRQWLGTISRNHPVVLDVDGRTIVIVPTFMPNASQPAGVVATEILDTPGDPKFAPFWQAPRFDTPEAHQRFRSAASHLAVSTSSVDGEPYVWVVDPTGSVATLLGIRARRRDHRRDEAGRKERQHSAASP